MRVRGQIIGHQTRQVSGQMRVCGPWYGGDEQLNAMFVRSIQNQRLGRAEVDQECWLDTLLILGQAIFKKAHATERIRIHSGRKRLQGNRMNII